MKVKWQVIQIYECEFRPTEKDVPVYTHTRSEDIDGVKGNTISREVLEQRVEDAANVISGIVEVA